MTADGGRPWALVALNMGGPDSLEAVRPFLRNLLSDPRIVRLPFPLSLAQGAFAEIVSRRRARSATEGYRALGGGSPLRCWSELQATKAAAAAARRGLACEPFVAMRYWKPFASEVAREIRARGCAGVAALTLYPQFSDATTGTSLVDFRAALEREGLAGTPYVEIDRWPLLPGYLDATAASVRAALPSEGPPPFVLFSAHGLPVSYVKRGDPYLSEIEATYRGVRERLPPDLETALSFQSRVGPAKWLEPYTDATIEALADRGVKRLMLVPLSFTSDNIETSYEMDSGYGDLARSRGLEFTRPAALNGDDLLCDALGALVVERVGALRGAARGTR
ncbi:MAG TPA: ferrochelatase [Planctomycetota bacterium]|nr:ferrochelatase [Planctomycetota bacterium]